MFRRLLNFDLPDDDNVDNDNKPEKEEMGDLTLDLLIDPSQSNNGAPGGGTNETSKGHFLPSQLLMRGDPMSMLSHPENSNTQVQGNVSTIFITLKPLILT